MASTGKSTKSTTAAGDSSGRLSKEERDAIKERAQELKADGRSGRSGKEADRTAVLDKIAELSGSDRELAERVHAIITDAAPELAPKLWYGQPAYAKDGKVVCFFQPAGKFKTRYSTLGFNDDANLDDGSMWPTAFAITKLSAADEKKIAELVKRAAS